MEVRIRVWTGSVMWETPSTEPVIEPQLILHANKCYIFYLFFQFCFTFSKKKNVLIILRAPTEQSIRLLRVIVFKLHFSLLFNYVILLQFTTVSRLIFHCLSVLLSVCLSVCLFELMYVYISYCLFNKLLRFILSFVLLSLCIIVANGGRSVWDNLIGLPASHYHYL